MFGAALVLACSTVVLIQDCLTEECRDLQARLATANDVESFRDIASDIAASSDQQSRDWMRNELDRALTNWLFVDDAPTAALIETHDEMLAGIAVREVSPDDLTPAVTHALAELITDREANRGVRQAASEDLLGSSDPQMRHFLVEVASDSTDPVAPAVASLLAVTFAPDELRRHAFQGRPPLRHEAVLRLAREDPEGLSAAVCAIAQDGALPPAVRWSALHVATLDCLATMTAETHWFEIESHGSACDRRSHSLERIVDRLGGMRTARALDLVESLEASLPRLDEEARASVALTIGNVRFIRRQFSQMVR